jgi:hypothetical protein
MKYLLIALAVFASGCTTVPVTAKFPEAPKSVENCPQLQKLNDGAKLSDISTTVNINYTTYYECAVKNDKWNEWYAIQKKIFEGVK